MVAFIQPLILTVNRRLATYLTHRYDQLQIKAGKLSWVSPSILSLEDWLKRLWLDHASDTRSLLTPYSEWVLWDQIIQQKTQHLPLIQRDSLVFQIQQAWQFLNQWNLPISILRQYPLDETHHFFIRAAEAFETACFDHQVIALSQVMPALIKHSIPKDLPQQIMCVGFDDVSPQLARFLKNLQSKVILQKTDFYEAPRKAQIFRIPFQDPAMEIEQAAIWARQQVDRNPEMSVGCVFLNLSEVQEKVRQVFQRVFLESSTAFNLSLGRPLADYPVIRAAVNTLSWCAHSTMELESIRAWLYSPFLIASQTEMVARSALSVRLLEQGACVLDWGGLCSLLAGAPKLAAALKQSGESINTLRMLEQSPNQWADVFLAQLRGFGWPGQRPLDSTEHQTVECFWKALDAFRQLNHLLQKITLSEAFYLLTQLMKTTVFQPGANEQSPVQVMGFLESSGILFDRLWVGGMREDLWPKMPSPNPFIPVGLQKQAQMPHASPERELSMSQVVTNRLCQSADQVILSYSRTERDRPPLPSSLIRSVKEITVADIFQSMSSEKMDVANALEILTESEAPPILLDESVRGGTAILKNQAACPFKAFAQARLGVTRPQKMSLGFNALDKGNLIHKVLEVFWGIFKQQKHLLVLSEDALRYHLQKITAQALEKIVLDRPWLFNSWLIEVEQERIVSLLLQWLALEKQRDPFDVVSIEKPLKVSFHSIELSVKMDRMDRLEDGTYALLDYKTGKISLKSWEGGRPDEPQLPFYWVMSDEPVSAIAFAEIQPGSVQFKGVSQMENLLPDVMSVNALFKEQPDMTWQALKKEWRQILEGLLLDFCKGKAQVDPKKGKETCAACGFEALCRVHEDVG